MADLVQWLRAQLDADAAEIADPYAEKAWHTRDCAIHPDAWGNEGSSCDCGVPARVLREVEAKRRIVEIHRVVGGFEDEDMTDLGSGCSECGYSAEYGDRGGWCETLRLLALPYEDRPDYQEAWRP